MPADRSDGTVRDSNRCVKRRDADSTTDDAITDGTTPGRPPQHVGFADSLSQQRQKAEQSSHTYRKRSACVRVPTTGSEFDYAWRDHVLAARF